MGFCFGALTSDEKEALKLFLKDKKSYPSPTSARSKMEGALLAAFCGDKEGKRMVEEMRLKLTKEEE